MEGIVSVVLMFCTAFCVDGLLSGGQPWTSEKSGGELFSEALVYLGRLLSPLLVLPPIRSAITELRRENLQKRLGLCVGEDVGALGLLAAVSFACALAGFVLFQGVVGVVLGVVLPTVALNTRALSWARACERTLESAMPEAFGSLAIALASGHSLGQAMRFVGAHAAEPVKSEFTRVSFAMDCGVSAATALDAMLSRLSVPGLDLVALALKVSQRTGAPLKDLLAEASRLVGTRIELKRQLDVKTSQARMSARLVAAMPVAMAFLLALMSDDFRRGMTLPAGVFALALALVLNVAAWIIISRIMKVSL